MRLSPVEPRQFHHHLMTVAAIVRVGVGALLVGFLLVQVGLYMGSRRPSENVPSGLAPSSTVLPVHAAADLWRRSWSRVLQPSSDTAAWLQEPVVFLS